MNHARWTAEVYGPNWPIESLVFLFFFCRFFFSFLFFFIILFKGSFEWHSLSLSLCTITPSGTCFCVCVCVCVCPPNTHTHLTHTHTHTDTDRQQNTHTKKNWKICRAFEFITAWGFDSLAARSHVFGPHIDGWIRKKNTHTAKKNGIITNEWMGRRRRKTYTHTEKVGRAELLEHWNSRTLLWLCSRVCGSWRDFIGRWAHWGRPCLAVPPLLSPATGISSSIESKSVKKIFFFGPRIHPLRAEPTMADDVFYLFFFKVSKNDPSWSWNTHTHMNINDQSWQSRMLWWSQLARGKSMMNIELGK